MRVLLASLAILLVTWTACTDASITQVPATSPVKREATVRLIHFKSETKLPVFASTPETEPERKLFEAAFVNADEGAVLATAVSVLPRVMRLTPEQATTLSEGFRRSYAEMDADPAFQGVESALPDAASRDPDRAGTYLLHTPGELKDMTRLIVFLHGYGGNFRFYMGALRRAFPNDVIVCPSYGMSWRADGRPFLDTVLADVGKRLERDLGKPVLMAISAGGPGAFAIYAAAPERFAGLVSLVTYANPKDIASAPADVRVVFVNGAKDDWMPIKRVRAIVLARGAELPRLSLRALDDADHFFLITRPELATDVLREAVAEILR